MAEGDLAELSVHNMRERVGRIVDLYVHCICLSYIHTHIDHPPKTLSQRKNYFPTLTQKVSIGVVIEGGIHEKSITLEF